MRMLAAARQCDKVARPNLRLSLSDRDRALALQHENRLLVGAVVMAGKGRRPRFKLVDARPQALHSGRRGKRSASIAELALGGFGPFDLVLIDDVRGLHENLHDK